MRVYTAGPITGSGDRATITFETSKAWKGQVTRTLTITTPGSSASCGVTFEQGKEYVVYGRVSEGVLGTNLCSRTRLVADAAEDIAALGAGQPPAVNQQMPSWLPATGAAENGSGSTQLLLVALGLLAVAVGGATSVISRRGRYIEDASGTFDWAAPDDEVHSFINDLERSVGTFLYGRRMYETMRGWETDHTLADQSPLMRDYAQIWQSADKIVYSNLRRTRIIGHRSFCAEASAMRSVLTGGERSGCAKRAAARTYWRAQCAKASRPARRRRDCRQIDIAG